MEFIKKNVLTHPLFIKSVSILLIIVVGLAIIKISTKLTGKALSGSKIDPVLHKFVINLVRIILWAVLIFTVFGQLGLSVSSLVTLAAAVGAAAALALQESLGNFAGGILILFSKPFRRGDLIEDMDISGRVQHIDLLYTTLATLDNKIVTVPNGKLANSKIINHSRAKTRRVDCKFGISYDSSISTAKTILKEISGDSPMILEKPEPIIGVSDHDSSAVIIDMLAWCNTKDYYDVKYFLEEEVKKRFDEAGIIIPFQQITVHLADGKIISDASLEHLNENGKGEEGGMS